MIVIARRSLWLLLNYPYPLEHNTFDSHCSLVAGTGTLVIPSSGCHIHVHDWQVHDDAPGRAGLLPLSSCCISNAIMVVYSKVLLVVINS
jgi:hypothetical protein